MHSRLPPNGAERPHCKNAFDSTLSPVPSNHPCLTRGECLFFFFSSWPLDAGQPDQIKLGRTNFIARPSTTYDTCLQPAVLPFLAILFYSYHVVLGVRIIIAAAEGHSFHSFYFSAFGFRFSVLLSSLSLLFLVTPYFGTAFRRRTDDHCIASQISAYPD